MSEEIYIETGVPGAVVSVGEVDLGEDRLIVERNGNGTVVAYTIPSLDLYPGESLAERVERLTAELKEARAELKRSSR